MEELPCYRCCVCDEPTDELEQPGATTSVATPSKSSTTMITCLMFSFPLKDMDDAEPKTAKTGRESSVMKLPLSICVSLPLVIKQ